MSINPLQTDVRANLFPERLPGKKSGSASFHALLDALHPIQGKPHLKGQEAAADLLRLEMMQSTLALSGEAQAPHVFSSAGIAHLLSSLSPAGNAVPSVPARASAQASRPAATDPGTNSNPTDPITATASRFLGTPYLFGGEGASGIDCSSLVQKVFHEHQISLPRTAREQIQLGSDVAPSDLKAGDLVFFRTYASYPSHVGIYIGDGKMIHASSAKGEVTVSDLNSNYYRSRFIGAKRIA